jgi:hypothetical protein
MVLRYSKTWVENDPCGDSANYLTNQLHQDVSASCHLSSGFDASAPKLGMSLLGYYCRNLCNIQKN